MKKFVLNNEIMDEIVYKTENVVIQKIQALDEVYEKDNLVKIYNYIKKIHKEGFI